MTSDFHHIAYSFLFVCTSVTIVSTRFLQPSSLASNERQDASIVPGSTPDQHHDDNGQMSMDEIFQHTVRDETELCPKQYVMLFLLTKDVKYLRACGDALGITRNRTSYRNPKYTPYVAASYSGNILKRILDNMEAGTAKVDFIANREMNSEKSKRARLSINGALGSLVEMLRHESRHHRRPQFAFHREMLNMG